ncbi:MAG TPA: uroporphyrinogen decarboxylase family protein [Armatimonadota bacterium]|nr:uroporphyrinogen decarboxylase family protein [Armatimonadota bacterium]
MPKTMTSKARVLTAFAHQEPDRVPIGMVHGNRSIDARLKAHFGVADTEGLYQALRVDMRGVGAPYVGPRLHAEVPGRNVDAMFGVHTRWIEHESGGYWDFCDFPLRDATLEEAEAWPMPSPDDFDYSGVAAYCEQHNDYCITVGGPGLGDIINSTGMLRTMEQVLVDLMTDDEAGLRIIDRKLDVLIEMTARTLDAAKGGIDVLWMGEDLGTQHAPLISLELFRQHIRPRHQQVVDLGRAYGIPVMIHTCGSSSWAYEDFIEMGIGVVDTLQPEAANMDPAYLKAHFGGRLACHGCISTAGPLAYGTVDDVVADVRKTLEIMKPGGGYVLAPTHSLQDNTPTANAVAMFEAAWAYGAY